MAPCPTCRGISAPALVRELLGEVPSWWTEHVNRKSKPRGMVHLRDARQLPLSAAAGCPMCAMIKDAAMNEYQKQPPIGAHQGTRAESQVDDLESQLINSPIYLRPNFDPLKRAFPQADLAGAPYIRGFKVLVPIRDRVLTGHIRLYALRDSPAATSCDIVGRPSLTSSDSPEAFDLINRWMDRCLNEHDACNETFSGAFVDERNPPTLPKRVLDCNTHVLGQSDVEPSPHLLEAEGKSGHYLALSHCWGANEKPLMTTQSTLEKHMAGIPWNELPKLYQDAITATRRLGYRYLWIDSLCIIQDSTSDWLHESKQMGTVYENARLTIAASHASDSSQPCFFPRPPPPASVELPYLSHTGERKGSIFATHMPTDYAPISPENSPLDARAWATQEWLLSRRMIFYTDGCLVWSCKSISQRETGGSFHSTARNARWKAIVEKYSARSLTNASDRLIALEGLRTELGKKREHDTYCFGLWKHSMPDHLLWYCRRPAERTKSPLCLPTWSWASTTNGVRFLDVKSSKNACAADIRFDETNKILSIRSLLRRTKVTSIDTKKNHSQDAFSLMTGFDPHGIPSIMMCALILINDEICGWGILDEGEPKANADIVSLLLMSRKRTVPMSDSPGRKNNEHLQYLLLLRKLDGFAEVYARVGAGLIISANPIFTDDQSYTNVFIR